MPKWLIRILMPEFWPYQITYFIPFCYILWKTIRLGNKFYPPILNPAIDEKGGFVGADKIKINSLFPSEYMPLELAYYANSDINAFNRSVAEKIGFPCFAKPSNMAKGVGVSKIENEKELIQYLSKYNSNIVVQACINLPEEYAVFIVKFPNEKVKILGLTAKQFLSVTGDGKKTILELLESQIAFIMAKDHIDPLWQKKYHLVPEFGETLLIQPVGNHNKPTTFFDISHKINSAMEDVFNAIVPAQGIHYGRFDIKAANFESLCSGDNLRIIEFNGTIAEPVSALDSKYSFYLAQKLFLKYYYIQFKLAQKMLQMGVLAPGLLTGISILRKTLTISKKNSFTFRDHKA